jgi:uncharacterized protein
MGEKYCIYKNSELIFIHAIKANSYFERMKGLLGKKSISNEYAMIFTDSPSIHTFFMMFPIDIIFLDKDFKIICIYENLKRNKIIACWKARYTVEMRENSVRNHNLKIGDKLTLKFINDDYSDDKGQTAVEYALILGVLIIGIIAFWPTFTNTVLSFISKLVWFLSDI